MKNSILYITILLLAASCKKNKSTNLDPISQWTFNGITYKGNAKSFQLSSNFESVGNTGNYISIKFHYPFFPKKNGIYTVKKNPYDSTQCSVIAGDLSTIPTGDYTSLDSTLAVTITVSSIGKLSATFSGIVLSDLNNTKTAIASGILVEQ